MYLLSTRVFAALVSAEPRILAWAKTVGRERLGASVVSLGVVRYRVGTVPVGSGQQSVDQNLRAIESLMRRTGAIHDFGERDAAIWANLLSCDLKVAVRGVATDLPNRDRMVVATALERSLVLVEGEQPYHSALSALRVLDPYG